MVRRAWIETPEVECKEKLFDDDVKRIGHAGEAYGLRAGLWLSPELKSGFAYFTTAVPSAKWSRIRVVSTHAR